MTNKEQLAIEYALGLINKTYAQAQYNDAEFEQLHHKWQSLIDQSLSQFSPFSAQDKQRIWAKINTQISLNVKKQSLTQWIKSMALRWQTGFAILILLIVSGFWAHKLSSQTLEWDIQPNLSTKQIQVNSTTHQHQDDNKSCALWAKQGDKFIFIGYLPETGEKTFVIPKELTQNIKQSMIIISVQDIAIATQHQHQPKQATNIRYQGKWLL